MQRCSTIGGALAAFLAAGTLFALPARAATVPAGTPVMMQFEDTVSPKTAKRGDVIAFRVVSDVTDNGQTVIRDGAPAVGIVESVKKPGRFGKRGELKIRMQTVNDVNGGTVNLEPYTSGKRFSAAGPGASAGGLLILGPVGLVGGAVVKGSNVTIDSGTRIEARV